MATPTQASPSEAAPVKRFLLITYTPKGTTFSAVDLTPEQLKHLDDRLYELRDAKRVGHWRWVPTSEIQTFTFEQLMNF